ncbi:MAG: rhodanese-like domain-containing protein [bacterium]|nr:rhodanese-like domain-containing protein [bacterium]
MIPFSFSRQFLLLLVGLFWASSSTLWAEQFKGKITSISKKAQVIQLKVGKETRAVKYSADTKWVQASSIKDLIVNDSIVVDAEPGQAAKQIERKVVKLPKGWLIEREELQQLLAKGQATMIDSRPPARYNEGHIPGALGIFADHLAKDPSLLPSDKNALLVFYCGGLTCGLSPKSAKIAAKAGYKNLRVYSAGMPDWKKAGLPVEVKAAWLAKNLGSHLVVLDAREPAAQQAGHIKGAVGQTPTQMAALDQDFAAKKLPGDQWRLPGLADKGALVVVYSDQYADPAAQYAFKYLKRWQYKNPAILAEGFAGWEKAGFPVQTGATATVARYVKKLAPGAIPVAKFKSQVAAGVTVLDVREDSEVQAGAIKGSIHMPLSQLDAGLAKLDKTKPLLIHCSTGVRAEMAYQTLKKQGFKQARFLNETININSDGSFNIE